MMRTFLYQHRIEIVLVAALLAVLLIVMIPRFLQHQDRYQISLARKALSDMTRAVQTYNHTLAEDSGERLYRGLIHLSDGPGSGSRHWTPYEGEPFDIQLVKHNDVHRVEPIIHPVEEHLQETIFPLFRSNEPRDSRDAIEEESQTYNVYWIDFSLFQDFSYMQAVLPALEMHAPQMNLSHSMNVQRPSDPFDTLNVKEGAAYSFTKGPAMNYATPDYRGYGRLRYIPHDPTNGFQSHGMLYHYREPMSGVAP